MDDRRSANTLLVSSVSATRSWEALSESFTSTPPAYRRRDTKIYGTPAPRNALDRYAWPPFSKALEEAFLNATETSGRPLNRAHPSAQARQSSPENFWCPF